MSLLAPQAEISEVDFERGQRFLIYDGVTSQIMGALTGGAFLVAYALAIGASNLVIGLLAAIGPLAQILQVPAVYLIGRYRARKFLVVLFSLASRLFWVPILLLARGGPTKGAEWIFIICLSLYFCLGSVSGISFNSWVKDLLPGNTLGSFFAKRLAWAAGVGSAVSLAAAVAADRWKGVLIPDLQFYAYLFTIGIAAGLLGVYFLSRIPEPKMVVVEETRFFHVLKEPLHDANYRKLMFFLAAWNFGVNLAAPFFTVYMIRRLELSFTVIIGLSVLSQAANICFFRIWGSLADRFSNKSVLAVSGPLFVVSIFLWPLTAVPDFNALTIPVLVLIHALAGVSTAGVTLCTGNIALKLAPKGRATSYLAMNSMASGISASIAPIVGGLLADFFVNYQASMTLEWIKLTPLTMYKVQPIFLTGLDFVFLIAVVFSLYGGHRLIMVKEEGEVEEKVVLNELYSEVRKVVKGTSNVAGLRHLTYFPFGLLVNTGRRAISRLF